MQIDKPLAYLTRRLGHIPGSGRLIRPLKRWFSRHYSDRGDCWTWIHDYRGRLTMKLDRAAYMGGTIYWRGGHHRHDLDYLEAHLSPDQVFVDVGANTGEFTVAVAAAVPQGHVLAFEPQPEVRATLQDNVLLNGFTNVTIFDFGLAEKTEQVTFYTSLDRTVHDGFNEGLYSRFADKTRNHPVGTVTLHPFDAIIQEQKIVRLDWMKVDIEGGELPMLKGAVESLDNWRPNLILEINEPMFRRAGYDTDQLLQFLYQFGYRAFQVGHRKSIRPVDPRELGDRSANVLFMANTRK